MTKSRAVNNKKTGARFEGDVRRVLKATGYFTVAKGVSTNGIDVFGIKKDNAT